jgi:hypothetical protein
VNYERLAEVKAKYDPENRFRHNQNSPAAPAVRGEARRVSPSRLVTTEPPLPDSARA